MTNTPKRNLKPTFQLTPVDKPDMSPYLFHLTTKDNLIQILKDKFLKLQKPRGSHSDKHDYAMVCFTESPPFALDFFRYRWNDNKDRDDLKYGIGFSKEKMVRKGVRPTAYFDRELIKLVQWLQEKLNNNKEKYEVENKEMHKLAGQISPLIFGNINSRNNLQGYSWEREWRYTKGNKEDIEKETEEEYKLKFNYDEITYICCPDEDKRQIQEIVGNTPNIKYLKTWEEYNEIIDFLSAKDSYQEDEVEELEEKQHRIRNLIIRYESGYQQIDKLKEHLDHITESIEDKIERQNIINIISNKLGKDAATGGVEKIIKKSNMSIERIVNNLAYTLCSEYTDPGRFLFKSIEKDYYTTCSEDKKIDEVNKQKNKIMGELDQFRKIAGS
ncbi:abortive infection system antitoxin AbiGi family protein [Synechocystis salina]|uniref:Uncharacterized protein n=1 Tax=Synechocystis salina LEGE 00031 TaxID=1828736 RepID=A0ABR9VPS2_9SYNC|nr:abortive infection system antitoxin AbiGi family protein [Synechocystis salina]MBE9240101.1 hypothetical protein [Synechocystis salina LEGE 00041]MBE9253324.1 hypothetical protein [Synechocystis salina LEGE 00031]